MVPLDVTSPSSIAGAVSSFGTSSDQGIDLLVNNAGIALGGFIEANSMEELREVFEANFFGLVAMTKAMLPLMRARGRGRIINISSSCGRMAMPALAAYSASKFAVEGFTEALRYEALDDGVWASCVRVGVFKTEIYRTNRRHARAQFADGAPHRGTFERLERYNDAQLTRNTRDPRAVAELVATVARSKRPALIYKIGLEAIAQDLIVGLLPRCVGEAAVMRVMRAAHDRSS